MAKTNEELLAILSQFALEEKVVSAEPFGNGHINDTLKVTTDKGEIKYVLQRINHLVFTNVEMLQHNIHVVTTHIREKLEAKGETDIDRKVLTFLPTKDGKYYYFDGDSYWRVCLFIPRSKSYEEVTPELSYEAGKAFGDFQLMLSDLPEGSLGETIPNFHNMEFRLQQFHEAVEANAAGRLEEVKDLVEDAILNCRSALDNGIGYGAGFEGLRSSVNIYNRYSIDSNDKQSILNRMISEIIYNAYHQIAFNLYHSCMDSKESVDIITEGLKKGKPYNIREESFDGLQVYTSIETDPAILDAISKIITIMYTSNQAFLVEPTQNVYISDDDTEE